MFDTFRKQSRYHTAVIVVIHPVTSVLLLDIQTGTAIPVQRHRKTKKTEFHLDRSVNTLLAGAKMLMKFSRPNH